MSDTTKSKPATDLDEKSEEVDRIMNLLEKHANDVKKLCDGLKFFVEVDETIKRMTASFSNLNIKELLENIHETIKKDTSCFDEMRKEVDELLEYIEKEKEIDVIVGALEIIGKDTKNSELARNLESFVFYIKENGTGDDSMTLLSRASWKW